MIGGLKKTASAFAIAAAAGVLSTSAMAADLGGNCCADLEERIAELEATTVRKGNRRVSLTLSGHVNEAVLIWDDGIESGARIVTNGFSMTRFRMRGSAKINADWSAGFYMEFGLGRTGMSYDVDQESGARAGGYNPVAVRHQALYIQSKRLGTLWLGWTTDAADGLIDICVGCPITSSAESSLGWGDFITVAGNGTYNAGAGVAAATWASLGVGQEGYFATRHGLMKYISPSFAGFSFSASWGDADDGVATIFAAREHGYDWDVALRYANEFNGVRVAGGVTYNEVSIGGADYDSWAIVGSLQHVPTGLYVQSNYRAMDIVACPAGEICEDETWSVQVGIVRKFLSAGATTFWFQYQKYENGYRNIDVDQFADVTDHVDFTDAEIFSFGINQKIDAAAMELYLTYWNVSADVNESDGFESLDDLNVVMMGARIRF